MKTAILNRKSNISTLDGVIMNTGEIMKLIFKSCKEDTAEKIVDTEDTLIYKLK